MAKLLAGTEFERKVWKEISKIPWGQTISYKELAKKVGRPRAYRAVANACGKNPLPVVIPCHRVITSDGTIGGFSRGVEIKKILLKLESNHR